MTTWSVMRILEFGTQPSFSLRVQARFIQLTTPPQFFQAPVITFSVPACRCTSWHQIWPVSNFILQGRFKTRNVLYGTPERADCVKVLVSKIFCFYAVSAFSRQEYALVWLPNLFLHWTQGSLKSFLAVLYHRSWKNKFRKRTSGFGCNLGTVWASLGM